MIDVKGEWYNPVYKFMVLADHSNFIVGVVEHDKGGFLIEKGIISIKKKYRDKTYILKKIYNDKKDREIYSWMQIGVFNIINNENRLYTWTNKKELLTKTEKIP